ncbi:DNA polymerase iota [Aplysia californica]|uniref:DNA polymerase iota n=1 Tax=Aplysia californica TaxID=6500 RepID=A0ABM1A5G9_APLCA|nr:DNA polymerase iota [Aplysia californica]
MDSPQFDDDAMPSDEEWAMPLQDVPTPKKEHNRVVIHFDIDCFYAQVEMIRNPELRSKPLGIQQKNIVVTSNYIAREKGVTKLMYLTDAKKKCSDLVLVSGEDLTNYRHMSYQISEFLQKYSPIVERLGFDENFVDVTEIVDHRFIHGECKEQFVGHTYMNEDSSQQTTCTCGCKLRLQIGSQIAADMREALHKEMGITCCAGVAHNKLLAKLVAGTHKPNQQTSVLPHQSLSLVSQLPSARSIPGIGSKSNRRLQAMGISSVRDLQAAEMSLLEGEFGSATAKLLRELSFGIDDSPVTTFSLPQTLSDEDSFKCCSEYSDAEKRIKDLLLSLLQRVVEDGRIPQTIRLTVRRVKNNYHRESRQCPVQASIFKKCQKKGCLETACRSLMPILMNLFCKMVDASKHFHLTLINICFAKMGEASNCQGKISSFFSSNDDYTSEKVEIKVSGAVSPTKTSDLKLDESSVNTCGKDEDCVINECSPKDIPQSLSSSRKNADNRIGQVASTCESVDKDDNEARAIRSVKEMDVRMCKVIQKSPENNTAMCKVTQKSAEYSTAVCKVTQKSAAEYNMAMPQSVDTDIPSAVTNLQELLPSGIDSEMVLELPNGVQQSVLADYGIMVEQLPEGKRFVLMSSRVSTRSTGNTGKSTRVKKRLYPRDSLCGQSRSTSTTSSASVAEAKGAKFKKVTLDQLKEEKEACDSRHAKPSELLKESRSPKPEQGTETNNTSSVHSNESSQSLEIRNKKGRTPFNSESEEVIEDKTYNKEAARESPKMFSGLFPRTAVGETMTEKTEINRANENVHVPNEPEISLLSPSMISDQKTVTQSKVPQLQAARSYSIPAVSSSSSIGELSSPPKLCPSSKSHFRLPDHIDPDVFSALPSNIQGEIMAHVVMGNSPPRSVSSDANKSLMEQKDSKSTEKIKCKSQNTLLTYFKKK